MPATDLALADLERDARDASQFIDGIVQGARDEEREINDSELALINRHREILTRTQAQMLPLREAARVQETSRQMHADIAADGAARAARADRHRNGGSVTVIEYRSAGQYILDLRQASLGSEEARERINQYTRAAAHQTTADNLGVIPEPLVGPVLNIIDAGRPLIDVLGIRAVPGASFNRPKVTQGTATALQTAEKAELTSQKMLITRVPVTMTTIGGYVNVSRQDIDFSSPQIMDLVIGDLAAQYAIDTESIVGVALKAAATAQTPALTTSSTAAEVAASVWKAVGTLYTAAKGQGRVVIAASPDMMGVIGPLFPSVSPQNANSTGFSADTFGQGAQGAISGVSVIMSAGLASGTILAFSTVAAEVYEQRIGALQVTEPSVLGVQVAYAGYFAYVTMLATAILKLTA